MKRIQLFEFEDFDWFPNTIRSGMTNLIIVLHKMMGTKEVLAELLVHCRQKHPFSQIVDMGSGSGGIMPEAVALVNYKSPEKPLQLLLTNLHPNPVLVQRMQNSKQGNVAYSPAPLDATNLVQAPEGLKTMVNSFHHMPPKKAKALLKTAQNNQQPLLIYEMAQNTIPLVVWWVLLPVSLVILFIMAWLMTPFSNALTLKQLIFTYLIPVIPICYAWDGQASLPRTYTFDDINQLIEGLQSDSYTWEIAPAKKPNGKKLGYHILGLPVKNEAQTNL